jgi:cytochrome c
MLKILPLSLACLSVLAASPVQKLTLAEGLHDPMSLAVAPDGDVYVVEREGRLLRVRPDTGGVFEIGNLTVSALRTSDRGSNSAVEDGLQGIAVDPKFATNRWIYLYYSHPEKLLDRLSRFTIQAGKLDPASELVMLDVPSERHDRICHHGGSVQFGPDGLLYLSIGDNTNPFESDGRAPLDNRENHTPWDAQRSAGNTNDLRGKILRIRPTETGYEIPPGNLFPKGTAKTRPEIYAMGCRNPFRISIDSKNSNLYWGEVGPDAGGPSERGPAGHDEVNQATKAGNFGWPFLVGNNKPYPIVDFETNQPGRMTVAATPKNTGIRNTGLVDLPPAQPAFIWYPSSDSPEFPAMGSGGRTAMAGPVFYFDPSRKYNLLGREDDHTLLTYDWMRAKIWKSKLGNGEKLEKFSLLDDLTQHPMDMEMAADGSLWMLDYGTEWWFNTNGRVIRLLPETANHSPVINIEADAGNDRSYTVKSATDPDNDPITVTWWITTGVTERKLGSGSKITLPANVKGSEVRAVASDGKSPNSIARISLTQEKAEPELTLELTDKPSALGFGEAVSFKISSGTPPDASKTVVHTRYIPASGHDAGGPQFSEKITSLATSNQCFGCHQVNKGSVGPQYVDVALKYRDRSDALDLLKAKLKAGGSGVWGQIPMPPQIALKNEDADTILRAILGLADGISEIKGSADGQITLAPKPPTATPGGAWEFSAEAPGFTTAKLRVPAK